MKHAPYKIDLNPPKRRGPPLARGLLHALVSSVGLETWFTVILIGGLLTLAP